MTEQEAFNMLEKIPNRILLSVLKKEAKQIDDMILTAQASLLNDIPGRVIKTDTCSQACPACHSPVNGNYCINCGKALIY